MIDNDRMSYFDSGLQVFLSDSAIERGLKRPRTVSSEFQFPSQFPHSRPAVTGWSPAWRRKHTVTPASLLLLPNQKGDNFYSRFSPKLSSTFFSDFLVCPTIIIFTTSTPLLHTIWQIQSVGFPSMSSEHPLSLS